MFEVRHFNELVGGAGEIAVGRTGEEAELVVAPRATTSVEHVHVGPGGAGVGPGAGEGAGCAA